MGKHWGYVLHKSCNQLFVWHDERNQFERIPNDRIENCTDSSAPKLFYSIHQGEIEKMLV